MTGEEGDVDDDAVRLGVEAGEEVGADQRAEREGGVVVEFG